MKVSDVLGRPVVDDQDTRLGIVHDLRAVLPAEDGSQGLRIVALVVGPDTWRCRLAYAWGLGQGHARGLALLEAVVRAGPDVSLVATSRVLDWDRSGWIRVRGGAR